MNEISNYIHADFTEPDILSVKHLNGKCKILLKQIEELKYNYQEIVMNRYNREYTFIDGGKLTHIQPYKSKDVNNSNICKAVCSKDKNCYGFNIYDNFSIFNKYPTTCDFISSNGDIKQTGSISNSNGVNSVYIKINDENLRTTKKILNRLISEFQSTCNRNMEIISHLETFTPNMNSSSQFDEGVSTLKTINSNDTTLYNLKQELSQQQEALDKILNDAQFIEKEYDNSSLSVTHNNIMLSIYTIIVIILIIVVVKINIDI
jgi:hypothetical protein